MTVIEVPLTDEEIRRCLEDGEERTKIDEEELGWKYRHHGMASGLAHGTGFMGDTAVEKRLNSEGLRKGRDYETGDRFVRQLKDIRQDFRILGTEVGVKTSRSISLTEATKYGSFLYPAKETEGESRRVLPYPDYLLQAVMSQPKKLCWVCGYVKKETIQASPIREVIGKPAHLIPTEKYRAADALLKELGWAVS